MAAVNQHGGKRPKTVTGVEMMSKVIKEIATGMFLSADFSTTAFAEAKRVADVNDATWLEPADDDDACVLASVDGQFEVVDVSECE